MATPNNKSGFTLVEMLMAVAIFAIASVVITATFINAINLERETSSYQKLQNDSRYILEKMAKEIRGREITLIYPAQNPASEIDFLPDEYGSIVSIKYNSSSKDVLYYQDGLSDNLNSREVAIEDLKFMVYPTKDPFTQLPSSNIQPRVTILMKLANRDAPEGRYSKEITVQTTISSKFYKR